MANEVVRALAELQRRVDYLERPKIATPTAPIVGTVTKTISDVRAVSAVADQALFDANHITETQIAEGSIKTPHLDANAINGMTITGSTIRTGASAPSIVMGRSGGEPLLRGDASDASVWTISPNELGFWDPADDQRIRLNYGGLDLWSAAPTGSPGTWQSHSWLRSNALSFWDEGDVHWVEMSVRSTYPQMRFRSNTAISFDADGYGNVLALQTNGVVLSHYLWLNNVRSTTFPANMHWSSGDHQVYQTSSMGVNKLDQEPILLDVAEKVLDLTPKTWRDRGEVADDPDTTRRVPGLIAEEVQAASDAAGGVLAPLVSESTSEGVAIIGINYDRLAAYLIPLIRDLRDRVTALETP